MSRVSFLLFIIIFGIGLKIYPQDLLIFHGIGINSGEIKQTAHRDGHGIPVLS